MKYGKYAVLIFYAMALYFSHVVFAWAEDVSKGYVRTNTVWPVNSANGYVEIPVCWKNPSPNDAVERGWVQNKVAQTWEANSRVRFTGWGECGINMHDSIRIFITDGWPRVFFYGKDIVFHDYGMVLNLAYEEFRPSCGSPESQKKYCIEAVAVHEFGHALGFEHEQNRPDTPDRCAQDPGGFIGGMMIGGWDRLSVMNYCNPNWIGDGNLSQTDILMVQTFYGSPNLGPIAKLSESNHSVMLGGDVIFSASGSYDPDGGPLLYNWRFGDTNEEVTTAGPSVAHSFNLEGKFATILTVDDGAFISEPVYAEINVYDPVKIVTIIINTILL